MSNAKKRPETHEEGQARRLGGKKMAVVMAQRALVLASKAHGAALSRVLCDGDTSAEAEGRLVTLAHAERALEAAAIDFAFAIREALGG